MISVAVQGVAVTKKRKKLHGSVKKIITPVLPTEPEKAEIQIDEADDLYKEIRIENVVTDEKGEKDILEPGEDVDIVLEADPDKKQKL
jgi:hypothetical protein